MAYSESLASRIRTSLQNLESVEEKAMMGGLCFMVNDKMCVGIIKDDLMCRVDPDLKPELLEKQGCFEMMFTGRPMKAFVQVDETGLRTQADFDFWIQQCLDFNPKVKASKKKKKLILSDSVKNTHNNDSLFQPALFERNQNSVTGISQTLRNLSRILSA